MGLYLRIPRLHPRPVTVIGVGVSVVTYGIAIGILGLNFISGKASAVSRTSSPSSSVSALLPITSPSVSTDSDPSKGKASALSATLSSSSSSSRCFQLRSASVSAVSKGSFRKELCQEPIPVTVHCQSVQLCFFPRIVGSRNVLWREDFTERISCEERRQVTCKTTSTKSLE